MQKLCVIDSTTMVSSEYYMVILYSAMGYVLLKKKKNYSTYHINIT